MLRDGPSEELRGIVGLRTRSFVGSDWQTQLKLHAKGCYWPITKVIRVVGPFLTLEQGVVIADLPGSGDLNRARADQADAAIQEAGQIIIAADTRLLQTSVMDQLAGAGRLPHRLFRANEQLQVVIVGTSLDAKLPDPAVDRDEVLELGLNPFNASKEDIFAAVAASWRDRVRPVFRGWLRAKADQFLPERSESERDLQVAAIMQNVEIVATCAKDAELLRLKNKMEACRVEEDTGLPELRRLINKLAIHQKTTTLARLERRLADLHARVLGAIERSERMLGANIDVIQQAVNRSNKQVQEVQEQQMQIVDNLRLLFLGRFQDARETMHDKIQTASLRMRNIGREQVQGHLEGIHWKSLRSAVDPENAGFWVTYAGRGRTIDLREAMGGEMTRLVPQAWSMLADQRIRGRTDDLRAQVGEMLQAFASKVRELVEVELTDEVSRKTVSMLLDATLRVADTELAKSARHVTELLGKTSKDMQSLVDKAVDLSLVEVCKACWDDGGRGWTVRSKIRIIEGTTQVAEQAKQRCIDVADDAFEGLEQAAVALCKLAVDEMANIGKSLPTVLANTQQSRVSAPQVSMTRLRESRQLSPASYLY